MNLPNGFILYWQNKNKNNKTSTNKPKPCLISAPVNTDFLRKLHRSQDCAPWLLPFPAALIPFHSSWVGSRSGVLPAHRGGVAAFPQTVLYGSHLPFAHESLFPPLGAFPHMTPSSPAAHLSSFPGLNPGSWQYFCHRHLHVNVK